MMDVDKIRNIVEVRVAMQFGMVEHVHTSNLDTSMLLLVLLVLVLVVGSWKL